MLLAGARHLLEQDRPWSGLSGDALAFVLASLVEDTGRWLVVADEPDAADRVVRALRFFGQNPHLLPADDSRPYDGFSPDPSVVVERLRTLHAIEHADLVVAPARALMQRVIAPAALKTLTLHPEDTFDRDDLVAWLTDAGYLSVPRVQDSCCFAVRGDIVDVWVGGDRFPVRVDFFDDEIESLRRFSPVTQRTMVKLDHLWICPAREDRIDRDAQRRAGSELAQRMSEQNRGVQMRRRILEDLRDGIRFSGIEDYLPALVETVAPLELMEGRRILVVSPDDVGASLREFQRSAEQRWEALEDDERPLVTPADRFVPSAEVLDQLGDAHQVFDLIGDRKSDLKARSADGFGLKGTELAPVAKKLDELAGDDARVALVARNEKRADQLVQLFEPHGVELVGAASPWDIEAGRVSLLIGDLPRGFVAEDWAFLPAHALFGRRQSADTSDRVHAFFDVSVTSTAQLREGDYVVHRFHGIGIYRGIKRITLGEDMEQDVVRLEYRGGDWMMLPVTKLSELSRYQPAKSDATVRLDRLGGQTWARRTGKVKDSLLKMAHDLLKIYAKREIAQRDPYPAPGEMSASFANRFPHQETPDQAAAIEAVHADLSGHNPMDRLLCGDVGFGKTEVAMRAAMRVVEAGKQVAVLCPTTVLAYQHLFTFRDRFAGFPIQVEMLSRFNSAKEDREIKEGLRDGSVDIVVGTTALLGRSVRYKDLGLVVVDEEHRFGVRQKERFKKLRAAVDLLSMSATPIPRTLQMALSNLRSMSVMATPPAARLAVKTSLARFSETRVRDAILQEIARGGQVFFIHNRVETIEKITEKLQSWVPSARFAYAHGQMDSQDLEDVLIDFIQKRSDVLVCTSIVESGVDIPSVNTMLVHRADRFGLAQLYQLRGRVGRSDVRGRCLLLTPEDATRDSRKRLRVLVENTRLGSGFQVAAADLELRGGGNLLGDAQSGNIDAVGYEMWVELLDDAVHAARGDLDRQRIDPEVEVPVAAFIPDNLVSDPQERLAWYRRIAGADRIADVDRELDALEEEVGDLPIEVHNLAGVVQARLYCRELGIVRCRWLKIRTELELHPSSPLHERALKRVTEEHPKRFQVREDGDRVLVDVRFTPREGKKPFRYLRWVFTQLRREE